MTDRHEPDDLRHDAEILAHGAERFERVIQIGRLVSCGDHDTESRLSLRDRYTEASALAGPTWAGGCRGGVVTTPVSGYSIMKSDQVRCGIRLDRH